MIKYFVKSLIEGLKASIGYIVITPMVEDADNQDHRLHRLLQNE